jgi:hypothetical protein
MIEAGPLLRSRCLWAERETKCLTILERALLLLRVSDDVPETEPELNRCFYFCLLEASRELYPDDLVAPVPECNNQPDPDDESRASREGKRPDFQWIYLDRYEPSAHHSSKQFVVECKRLGKPFRPDWLFNLNYVNHGIIRFRDAMWAYGQRFPSGATVGYWQSMEGEQVLNEVNGEARENSFPDLTLVAWNFDAVTRLEHEFDRPIEPSPFRLHHLWIDLRSRGRRDLSEAAR